MSYRLFTRTWWAENAQWPGGLEPCAGRRHYKGYAQSEQEAIAFCRDWNREHPAGRLSRKCEFEEAS